MSRVGKMAIAVPKGVDVALTADQISVKGALGTLSRPVHGLVTIKNDNGTLSFAPADESVTANAMWWSASPRSSRNLSSPELPGIGHTSSTAAPRSGMRRNAAVVHVCQMRAHGSRRSSSDGRDAVWPNSPAYAA